MNGAVGETISRGPHEAKWMVYTELGQVWSAAYLHGDLVRASETGGWYILDKRDPNRHVSVRPEELASILSCAPGPEEWPVIASQTALLSAAVDEDEPEGSEEHVLLRESLLWGDQITKVPPPQPLVEGVLDLNSIAVIYGQPGHGKSFAAVDLSCFIAAGRDWHGHAVTAAKVLYLAAEDTAGLGMRFAAWEQRHGVQGRHEEHLAWLGRSVNLFEPRWADAVAALAREIGAQLVVIDTLAKSMIGADENTSKDMGMVVGACDRIRCATGACVLPVHHMGKDRTAGMRGSNSLLAGVDTAWESTLDGTQLSLTCTRQKNHAASPKPLRFELSAIADSCVIQVLDTKATNGLHESLLTTLEALNSIEVPGGVSASRWRLAAETSDRSFYRHIKALLDQGAIVYLGTDKQPRYLLTESGRQALCTATAT